MRRVKTEATGEAVLELARRSVEVDNLLKALAEVFLGVSSVDFIVRPWAKTEDYRTVYWDVTRQVKTRFDEEGISIPFPQRDVHVYHEAISKGPKTMDVSTRQPVDA